MIPKKASEDQRPSDDYFTATPVTVTIFSNLDLMHLYYQSDLADIDSITTLRGSFTPLVFSSGGMGRSATVTYQRLASLLSDKWNSPYSVIMGWLRCSLSFSLLRSALMCVRGSRSRAGSPGVPVAVDLTVAEGHLVFELPYNFCRFL